MTKIVFRKFLRIQVTLTAASLFIFSVCLNAQNFEEGVEAYLAGNYLKAYRIWKPLAEKGGAVAMFNIGVLYAQGLGLERNDKIAFEWYRKSAEGGYAPAQFNFGTAYANGLGVEADDALAAKWWQAAANQGHLQAQYNLATLYYFGRGVGKNINTAKSWYQKAADRGDQRAKAALATIAKQSEKNVITPRKSVTTQAGRQKQSKPPTKIASVKQTTVKKAVSPERSQAARTHASELSTNEDWIRQQKPNFYTVQLVADPNEGNVKKYILRHNIQGLAAYFKSTNARRPWYKVIYGSYASPSQAKVAVRQLPPEVQKYSPWIRSFRTVHRELSSAQVKSITPTPKPVSKPIPKTKQASRSKTTLKSRANRATAPLPTGTQQQSVRTSKISSRDKSFMLQKGQHAFNVQNYTEAQKFWTPLAETGVAEAQYGLGFMHESGWGVKKDYNTAIVWYTQAANQGHAKSQYNLGMLYILGQGVEQNNSLGLYWVQNAADNNDKRAQGYIERSRFEKTKKSQVR